MDYTVTPSDNLNEAINRLKPGDVLNLESGTYNQVIDVVLMGTPDKPITIQGLDPTNRPVISGGAPRNLEEANERGIGINHGLPDGRYAKRNMNKGSITYGAEARNKGLLNFQHDSGNYIIRDVVFTDSLGRILNHEAASTDKSQNITFINVDMHWARLQILSIKKVKNVRFENCRFSNGASFYQTTGRPGRGPEGDLQTHNAGLSFGGVDGLEMIDCVVWDVNGEGVILSANREMSKNILIRNFTGYDCYKNPLYIHAVQNVLIENVLSYRSEENQALGDEGKVRPDDPVRKTNGPRVQSSEGNKDWGIATQNVTLQNVICHHTNGGLVLAGSPNTEPISNITFQDCMVINADGTSLTLLGNEPKNVTVTSNTFYHDNPDQNLADGAPNRYDNTSIIAGNKWSNEPDAFYTGPGDVYGVFPVPIQTEPLKRGTLITDLLEPPQPPPVDSVTERLEVGGVVWTVTATGIDITIKKE